MFIHFISGIHRPLLAFLTSLNEQAIVIGYSLGGMNLALAMDLFPHKISVGLNSFHAKYYTPTIICHGYGTNQFVIIPYIFFCKFQIIYLYLLFYDEIFAFYRL